MSEDSTEHLFGNMNFEPDAKKLSGSFKEKRAALEQAIDDTIIGQRITAIKIARTNSDFSFQAIDGSFVPAKQIELQLRFDNNVGYILRIEAVIKDMGEALVNIVEDEGAGE